MNIVGMIPARMGSSRFPGKPLAPILGRTMIEHVYKRCAMAGSLSALYVATCDAEIVAAVQAFGGKAIMTAPTHERASDRIAEAARSVPADDYVMIQGDEPMTVPDMIERAVRPFREETGIECVNLTRRIANEADFRNPDTIKVVMDKAGFALFMSREPIPNQGTKRCVEVPAYKQVCIIPFTAACLKRYAELAPTPLEIAESIDMMRLIENGHRVRMVESPHDSQAVDRPEDLTRVEALLANDPLTRRVLG